MMTTMASQITSLTVVYSTVYSDADQRKHQSSASLALVWGIHRGPVNSPRKWPVTRNMFPFDDVIIVFGRCQSLQCIVIWYIQDDIFMIIIERWNWALFQYRPWKPIPSTDYVKKKTGENSLWLSCIDFGWAPIQILKMHHYISMAFYNMYSCGNSILRHPFILLGMDKHFDWGTTSNETFVKHRLPLRTGTGD